jgi:hypothetical protein
MDLPSRIRRKINIPLTVVAAPKDRGTPDVGRDAQP